MHQHHRVLGRSIIVLCLLSLTASADPEKHHGKGHGSSDTIVEGDTIKRAAPPPANFYNTDEDQNGLSITTPMGTVSATKKDLYAQKRDHWLLLQHRCDTHPTISMSGGKCDGDNPSASCVHPSPICAEANAARHAMNDQMKWNEPNPIVKGLGWLVGFTGVRGFIDQ